MKPFITLLLVFSFLGSVAQDLDVPNNSTVTISSDANYNDITLGNKSVLNIVEGVTVNADNLNVENNATLNLDGVLNVLNNISVSNNGAFTVNSTGILDVSGDVNVSNNSDITLDGNVQIDGDFTAPDQANVTIDGTVNVGGSFTGTVDGGSGTLSSGNDNNYNNPLPVELLGADIESEEAEVTVTWTTATETNNDFFTLYISRDMNNWEELDRVAGNGTKSTLTNYEYSFNSESNGQIYIKLIQTDFDGTTETLRVLSTEVNAKDYRIYPQPLRAGAAWKIRGLDNDDTFKVYSSSMQEIRDSQNLTRGLYYVVINDKKVKKLIVQ
ncbi:MAG TPA: hypothetical protein VJ937_07685 [Salinivirga sp.]|uniref:hypothetical protein n=1 Tax=Salinivirga sp. TaxID=1970192 RepID=UPI002B470C0E|nr:hypothetical protein [Salinivirga sp.]HKK59344.1 hypothetical protein [Salinivirga sp.]